MSISPFNTIVATLFVWLASPFTSAGKGAFEFFVGLSETVEVFRDVLARFEPVRADVLFAAALTFFRSLVLLLGRGMSLLTFLGAAIASASTARTGTVLRSLVIFSAVGTGHSRSQTLL